MKLSTTRILTTHAGSLPRSQTVVDLLFKREQGEAYDREEFDRVMEQEVSGTVRKQVEIGIEVLFAGTGLSGGTRSWWSWRPRKSIPSLLYPTGPKGLD